MNDDLTVRRTSIARWLAVIAGICLVAGTNAAPLPWEQEEPLRQAAVSTFINGVLDPRCPQAANARSTNRGALALTNPQIKSSLWGPPNRVTLSLLKTDVFDRRYGCAPAPTLEEIRRGAFSPANKGFDDMPPGERRPVRGYLLPEGGRFDPFVCWNAYPFPCEKPVGQIILGLDELADAPQPVLSQRCSDGVVRCAISNGQARAELDVLLSMTRNVVAIHGRLAGVNSPWLRLYRHTDQAFRRYMTPDGRGFLPQTPGAASGYNTNRAGPFDYAKDAAWNGPVAPPESGSDGRFFWIRQKFPAEKTFPKGFEYVLMGVVGGAGSNHIETADGRRGLGTPPYPRDGGTQQFEESYGFIREAAGSAVTASVQPDQDGYMTVYVTVVTVNDAVDFMGEARRRLAKAAADGFEKLVADNTAWYRSLYDQREEGRIYSGDAGTNATDNLRAVFQSWYCGHGGGCKPDMRHYESTASYANLEQDWQLWHSLPCYNELFYTPTVVRNRADAVDMWWKLEEHWQSAARANARETYGMPGMMLLHGYLPPVKPDRYVHTSCALEYTLDTAAQVLKVLWDQWDYGADTHFLKNRVYPPMHDLATFFAAYAQMGADGYYHVIPSIEAEAWGIFPEFARGKDTISALCMFRWTFLRAAEAAEFLHVDAAQRRQWLDIAAKLAPYPTYPAKEGIIFNAVDGTVPAHNPGDHPFYIGHYPTLLADEINLDSPEPLRAQMIRTALAVRTSQSADVVMLFGASRSQPAENGGGGGRPGGPAPEALVNSRSGRIHLFPDTAADEVVAFRHFQARGGFLVSAAKNREGVTFVEIEARRDIPCALMNPWPGQRVSVREQRSHRAIQFTLDKTNGECLIFAARNGSRYQISRE